MEYVHLALYVHISGSQVGIVTSLRSSRAPLYEFSVKPSAHCVCTYVSPLGTYPREFAFSLVLNIVMIVFSLGFVHV